MNSDMNEPNALSVISSQDAMDDFPVLKAFQQYVDNEQAKARKRMISMGIVFGLLLLMVVTVFVTLFIKVTERNQALNDRLVEFAMKERDRVSSPVVVQPPQDTSVVLTLTSKIEEMQKQLAQRQAETDRLTREAAEQAAKAAEANAPKAPSAAEIELAKVKAQLQAEREKRAAEKEAQHQAELEAYRRKYYPELYAPVKVKPLPTKVRKSTVKVPKDDVDAEIDNIINDVDEPVSYFDLDDDEEVPAVKARTQKPAPKAKQSKAKKSKAKQPKAEQPEAQESETKAPEAAENYTIPVEVKKSALTTKWRIPND